jgi:membrane associated rhomboid family serine protease
MWACIFCAFFSVYTFIPPYFAPRTDNNPTHNGAIGGAAIGGVLGAIWFLNEARKSYRKLKSKEIDSK